MTTTSITDERREANLAAANGLRALADFIDANPDLHTPWTAWPLDICNPLVLTLDKKAALRAWARASASLRPAKQYDEEHAYLTVDFGGGVKVKTYAQRDEVCERIITGTREVTKTVKDPDALAAVPEVEVTVTEETVEWICHSLLGGE